MSLTSDILVLAHTLGALYSRPSDETQVSGRGWASRGEVLGPDGDT